MVVIRLSSYTTGSISQFFRLLGILSIHMFPCPFGITAQVNFTLYCYTASCLFILSSLSSTSLALGILVTCFHVGIRCTAFSLSLIKPGYYGWLRTRSTFSRAGTRLFRPAILDIIPAKGSLTQYSFHPLKVTYMHFGFHDNHLSLLLGGYLHFSSLDDSFTTKG